MRIKIARVVIAIILASVSYPETFAQRVSQGVAKATDPAITNGDESHEQGNRRSAVIQRVHTLVETAASFKDYDSRLRTLVFLADVLWKKGADKEYARQLFLRTFELLKSFIADLKRAPISGDPKSAEALEAGRRARNAQAIRRLLIEYTARHDMPLALRIAGDDSLMIEGTASPRGQDHLDIANNLINTGEYQAASKFARQAVGEKIIGRGHLHSLAQMLLHLREGDKASADELFVIALSNLTLQPGIGIDDLMILGSYLFKGSALPAGTPPDQIIITPIRVGTVWLAADITADRHGISLPVVRVFLMNVLQMKKEGMNSLETQRYAAACSLLLPKAQRYAADLSPELSELAAGAGIVIPLTAPGAPSSFFEFAGEAQSLQTALHKLDELKDQGSRDEYCLLMMRAYYARGDLHSAKILAEKVSDASIREKLLEVLSFRLAAKFIEEGELDAAEKAVRSIGSRSKRALLSLGLATAALAKKDIFRARAALNSATKELSGNSNTSQNARLVLAVAETFAGFDPVVAAEVLEEAVRAYNRIGYGIPNDDPIHPSVKISLGKRSVTFDTRVRTAKQGNFYEVLKPLIRADFERAWGAVLSLKSEQVQILAMPALASAALDDDSKKPVKVSAYRRR